MTVKMLDQVLKKYIIATNSHDFVKVSECISKKAIYWFTNKSCTSIKKIEEYFCNTWKIIKDEKYSAHNIDWIAISDTVATCIYEYRWEGYINDEFKSGKGRATNIFQKENHEWKLIHEHLSHIPD